MVQNADELFDRPDFSAAADIGWPDTFNSGVFVYAPSLETYRKIFKKILFQRRIFSQFLVGLFFSEMLKYCTFLVLSNLDIFEEANA